MGKHGLMVDGFHAESNTAFQFHGCFWHGHPCSKTRGVTDHPYRGMSVQTVYQDTLDKESYVRALGYNLTRIWECEWERVLDANPSLSEWNRSFLAQEYGKPGKTFTQEEILESVKSGDLFGLIECDISVPANLRSRFDEMAPIFKNTLLSRKHLSEHMLAFAQRTGTMTQPQRCLVGSLHGEKLLLASALLKWYLKQGLEVSKVYRVYQYRSARCYKKFGESVSDARRDGDANPDLALLAETSKLVGNLLYGKTITDKEKHTNQRHFLLRM